MNRLFEDEPCQKLFFFWITMGTESFHNRRWPVVELFPIKLQIVNYKKKVVRYFEVKYDVIYFLTHLCSPLTTDFLFERIVPYIIISQILYDS